MRNFLRTLLIIPILFCGVSVEASPITFDFTGIVTQVPLLDPGDPFSGAIDYGTTFSGSYTFESAASDLLPSDSQTGVYTMSGPPFGLTVTIGGVVFAAQDYLNISIANDYSGPVDQYTLLAQNTSGSDTYDLELFLQGDATLLGNDGLPLSPLALSSFTIKDFHLSNGLIAGNQVQIDGQINSITGRPKPVPEPGTALLLTTGIIGLWATLRRRFL